ncbi:ADP-ribose pyrophosphatase YjhB, NUDIX family [Aquimarina amphilecti]|uniref:ADP-ribose pyrophosphatase YjhB, NUDIX family n=1 Tax=Aquimarina amphilecti TaxID=1038014 RepID=A0A1H7UHD8_AQUAM|nr:NUDIX domain-containing protein [Aquimarina amphilecti]SEL96219.1 ADP-ribose pyrophosphatase YjhB, NUDIX family [Aquimarina amphilecti]
MDFAKNQQNRWYQNKEKMFVAIDCIIFGFDNGVLKLLVFKREIEPLKGSWSLIGSFVRFDENSGEAANRILKDITGLEQIFTEELKTYSNINRDPGARCISIAQYALIPIDKHNKDLVEKHGAFWFPLNELPNLALDHDTMVADALERLRNKAKFFPLGFELLPKSFTLPQIQLLYEEIFQKKLDARNFRKKILSLELLTNTKKKDKTSSKKGAFLYQFDPEKYKKFKSIGFDFPILKNNI